MVEAIFKWNRYLFAYTVLIFLYVCKDCNDKLQSFFY